MVNAAALETKKKSEIKKVVAGCTAPPATCCSHKQLKAKGAILAIKIGDRVGFRAELCTLLPD